MAVRTKLTLKQERFARAYVVEGNGAEAVVKAGYNVKNRSIASQIATENLEKPIVKHAIQDWRARLEAAVLPSLDVIEKLRDNDQDSRIRLAASRDLLNRAGIGKHIERTTNVVAVFSQMDETTLLEKMAMIVQKKETQNALPPIDEVKNGEDKQSYVSANNDCATHEKSDGVEGFGSPAAK